ncbi:hypothetical protein [Pendulispora albinea]|uniref:Lipoprotein n=1 Tax=Pendulispora albinea TaxID=2741071 RepID=A0ABZ2LJC9_9BACT
MGLGAGVAGLMVALAACGGDSSGVSNSKLPVGARSEAIEHEACTEAGNKVTLFDANGDSKPDIRMVYDQKSGKEVCRITDLNYDGRPDMFQYYDPSGQLRRREADYDGDGVVEAIEYYEGGKLVRRELDISGQHRLDTWDYFDPATGKRTKRERDNDGDGRVDQWWTWNGDQVTIAFDKNNDGQPDPNDTVTLNASGTAITTAASVDGGAPPLSTAASLGGAGDGGAGKPVVPSSAESQLLDTSTSGGKDAGAKGRQGQQSPADGGKAR